MLNFQLFRIRVFLPKQTDWTIKEKSPSEILEEVVKEMPSAKLRHESLWNVGNVKDIDDGGIYFRFGKILKSKMEVYENGNFKDMEFEMAPYTHVVLDTEIEVCAIAAKTKLSPYPLTIAMQLRKVLNQSKLANRLRIHFDIDEIMDPEDFISHLKSAFLISKFWLTFKRPNPWDVDNDIVKPLQRAAQNLKADEGKTEFKGNSLPPDHLERLARSAASTGDDAGALLKLKGTSKN